MQLGVTDRLDRVSGVGDSPVFASTHETRAVAVLHPRTLWVGRLVGYLLAEMADTKGELRR